jgi:uncharacterized protein
VALEMKGEYALPVQQAELWRLLNDPDVLAKIIPGCNTVRAVGPDRYEMGLKLQVGSVSGEYMGSVGIFEKQEPLHYVLMIEGQGSIGFMKGSAALRRQRGGGRRGGRGRPARSFRGGQVPRRAFLQSTRKAH